MAGGRPPARLPLSTLELDGVVHTADEVATLHLLSCTELRGVTISPMFMLNGHGRHFMQAIATLGRWAGYMGVA